MEIPLGLSWNVVRLVADIKSHHQTVVPLRSASFRAEAREFTIYPKRLEMINSQGNEHIPHNHLLSYLLKGIC